MNARSAQRLETADNWLAAAACGGGGVRRPAPEMDTSAASGGAR